MPGTRAILDKSAPAPSLASLDGGFFLTKGKKWAYECEWRMLVPLKDATRSMTTAGDAVHLFEFPSDALRVIVLGAHATPALETSVRDLLGTRPALSHVNLLRAVLDLNKRRVRVFQPPPEGA